MAKKLTDILEKIEKEEYNFQIYLNQNFPSEVIDFINRIKSVTHVYLFSGIIRDYFIKDFKSIRDIDLIYEDNIDLENLFEDLNFSLNSFGGYKINLNGILIDIWKVDNTWGLKNGQLKFLYSKIYELTNTTFFNFSSIIYSFNEERFIVGKPFLQFLRDKKIDIVLSQNPSPELCIINSFYYSEKMDLDFSKKINKYLINNFHKTTVDKLLQIQLKHFNQILFSENDLIERFNKIKLD